MARNDPKQPASTGKIKFRVIEFEMEGGNERLEQGLRTLAQAVTQQGALPARTITGQRAKASPALVAGEDMESTIDDEEELLADDSDSPADETSSNSAPSKPRPRPAPKAPKFLSGLNLASASVQLDTFIAEKDPKDTQEKYIVIMEWLKEQLATDEVSADHIFTAYRHLGWQSQLPSDPGQPLRDLKYKKHWVDAGTAKASFKINWNGTNYVNKMGAPAEK